MIPGARISVVTACMAGALGQGVVASCGGESAPVQPAEAGGPTSLVDAGPDESDGSGNRDAGPEPITCERADWCPDPSANVARYSLTSVWGTGPSNVWAVGSLGTVLHFDGNTWTRTSVGSGETLRAVWANGDGGVWVGGEAQETRWAGSSAPSEPPVWQTLRPIRLPKPSISASLFVPGSAALESLWGLAGVAGAGGAVYGRVRFIETSVAGNAFAAPPTFWRLPAPNEPVAGWAAVGVPACNQTFPKSPAGAAARALWGRTPTELWALAGPCAFHGQVGPVATADAGPGADFTWDVIDTQSFDADLHAVWGPPGADVWLVGQSGRIRRWHEGTSVEVMASPTRETLHGVWGTSAVDVWAVGDSGTVLHYDGTVWAISPVSLPEGMAPNLYGIWGSDSSSLWVVGEGIVLRHREAK